jgi:putative DNA primase/helicase
MISPASNISTPAAIGRAEPAPARLDSPQHQAASKFQAALASAAGGWRTLPLHEPDPSAPGRCSCANPKCQSPGKHPRTRNGIHDATVDLGQIRSWFSRWPCANYGIATGKTANGRYLVVVDVDPRHGGAESLGQLEHEHGPLRTMHVRTGSGGDHFYFETDEPVRGSTPLQGIDIKAVGGYVVGPGSVHASGYRYEVVDYQEPAPAPEWLLSLVRGAAPRLGSLNSGNGAELTAPCTDLAIRLLRQVDNSQLAYDECISALHFFKGSVPCEDWDAEEVREAVFDFGLQYEGNAPDWIFGKWDSIHAPERGWNAFLRFAESRGIDVTLFRAVPYPVEHPASAQTDFEAHAALVGQAPPPYPLVLDPSDPYKAAQKLLERDFTRDGIRTLHAQNGNFHVFDRGAHREVDDEELDAKLWAFMSGALRVERGGKGTSPFKPTISHINNVRAALRATAYQNVRAPAWLQEEADDPPARELISVANGILHVPTRQLLPRTPRFYTHNALPFPWIAPAPEPTRWLAFLRQNFQGDDEQIRTLQEIFGYLLLPDTSQQKAFLVTGPKRSGKGTIARVLTELLGAANVCSPTLSSLQSNFGLAPLIGKLLAVIPDARLSGRADKAAVAESILTVSGEDASTIDRKHRDPITVRLSTRFLIFTNETPSFADASGALASRFIVLKLERSFFGNEDPGLLARLLEEMPGIFAWALDGLDRLRERGRFVQPASSADVIEELEDLASPISAFLREHCVTGPQQEVRCSALFEAWRRWCHAGGRPPGSLQMFGRNIKAVQPSIRRSRPRNGGGRQPTYTGIALHPDYNPFDFSDIADEVAIGEGGAA